MSTDFLGDFLGGKNNLALKKTKKKEKFYLKKTYDWLKQSRFKENKS